ncbi:hypothetical protein O9992_28240 [Vibrio lentus]|nr:hypothetical protein [Vibrio lentus]
MPSQSSMMTETPHIAGFEESSSINNVKQYQVPAVVAASASSSTQDSIHELTRQTTPIAATLTQMLTVEIGEALVKAEKKGDVIKLRQ